MEVASPLTFQPSGNKRSFACSPPVGSTMDVSDDYSMQHMKRRRFESNTSPHTSPSFGAFSAFHNSTNINRSLVLGGGASKRSRTESGYVETNTSVIEEQASEIASLKTENTKLSSSSLQLKTEHDKVSHENRLLKKLVTHQHERQHQLQTELQGARKYKEETDDRISKMEQMILQLRYHLQAQQQPQSNDFMGMTNHDVY
mmetsp:Transcript_16646/g.27591  ORF Transcript_16646/g.27591 Transcript_16646/m.27591 type:complete len:201 (+) Transcript_16646:169-771(+)|eukprot:CAMPEP_0119012314 /NCGR_PEP_ID=MMETSP1176-20130426/6329_1 /TAXON_ID=265551 /ORGANISM="Synedropsis recta cf, Strain CCMP1620" /LENGTH=200 /DNA_ID=CAMNT_0006965245 /DNA_START=122 /DNA_END=724 /DNA_ORIENTATION=+